ncbi:MAG: hypothetical protein GY758_20750 [Fuerstiella sp.]|nr:hypothetical protein [Fuerstiella sp.]MCP4782885.1 hypothetical protein [Fuerstiella sp.]MCP4857749.1 hypothetical protein [Fuerstiella sp.]
MEIRNLCFTTAVSLCCVSFGQDPRPTGDAVIRAPYADSDIVITTTSRLAGAIHSLTWAGQEFVDSHDHGRQLQSASNFDVGSRMISETFNPTEAGSRFDGAGPTSSSRLLRLIAEGNTLQTTSRMAFWLRPGEKSDGNPAKNTTELSDHLLTKRVTIGYRDMPNVLQYDVTFSLPVSEHHRYAQFEALTGYMPEGFSSFYVFNRSAGNAEPLSDGPGEQPMPVILATPSGSHAMGIYTPQLPQPGQAKAGYGRWRFVRPKVVKWNCVFRVRDSDGVEPGDYSFHCLVIVGTLDAVVTTMVKLHRENE